MGRFSVHFGRIKTYFCSNLMRLLMEALTEKKKEEEREEDSRVGLKVSVVNSLNELLCDLYDLLFAS